jgi:hypothetical protein
MCVKSRFLGAQRGIYCSGMHSPETKMSQDVFLSMYAKKQFSSLGGPFRVSYAAHSACSRHVVNIGTPQLCQQE